MYILNLSIWSRILNVKLQACDLAAPLVDCKLQKVNNNSTVPPHIRNLLNKRKRLLRKQKSTFEFETQNVIRLLNKEILCHNRSHKRCNEKPFSIKCPNMSLIFISEYNQTYHTHTSC